MHRTLLLLLAAPALLSAAPDPLDAARRDLAAARTQADQLEQAAAKAQDEVGRIHAERAAAASRIAAAEADLALTAQTEALLRSETTAISARLAEQQRPASALLAGLVMMGRRPPLLALVDRGSLTELVRARALLDMTLPVVRARSAAFAADLARIRNVSARADATRAKMVQDFAALRQSQAQFAALESKANARAALVGGAALGAGDRVLSAAENADQLTATAAQVRDATRHASAVATLPEAPPRPGDAPTDQSPQLAWSLPSSARVLVGLAEVSPSGVRSRGLTLDTYRGAAITTPAAGRIAFAGPFRRYDGVVIIDHGGGWTTLLTQVRTALPAGTEVAAGDLLGRALGPISVELRYKGNLVSAALIAGSSAALSKTESKG